jgi:hypothetical protein
MLFAVQIAIVVVFSFGMACLTAAFVLYLVRFKDLLHAIMPRKALQRLRGMDTLSLQKSLINGGTFKQPLISVM